MRPLSERGHAEARALAKQLGGHATPPRVVFSSPLLRARQTAEAIAEATSARLQVDERLGPGTSADRLRAVVSDEPGPAATVCHQPDCSEIAVALTGRDPGFRPGGVAEITLDG